MGDYHDLYRYQDIFLLADFECCIDDQRQFTPNLVCFERETFDL